VVGVIADRGAANARGALYGLMDHEFLRDDDEDVAAAEVQRELAGSAPGVRKPSSGRRLPPPCSSTFPASGRRLKVRPKIT
jgi:hypothetical protein